MNSFWSMFLLNISNGWSSYINRPCTFGLWLSSPNGLWICWQRDRMTSIGLLDAMTGLHCIAYYCNCEFSPFSYYTHFWNGLGWAGILLVFIELHDNTKLAIVEWLGRNDWGFDLKLSLKSHKLIALVLKILEH